MLIDLPLAVSRDRLENRAPLIQQLGERTDETGQDLAVRGFADPHVKADGRLDGRLAGRDRPVMVAEDLGDLVQVRLGAALSREPGDVDLDELAGLEQVTSDPAESASAIPRGAAVPASGLTTNAPWP